jgi:integrase/recombinase XerD
MTPLRAQMIKAMQLRGFSPRTHQSYLAAVTDLARYYHRSPDDLAIGEIRAYFRYLVLERRLAPASCRRSLHAVRFLSLKVLDRPDFDFEVPLPKRPQRIPELLTRAEVAGLLRATMTPKQHALLATCYGYGLRVTELVTLKIAHLDSERRLMRIVQGKGAKDRQVTLPETLLHPLRAYWRQYRPTDWLFPGQRPDPPLSVTTAQKSFHHAKAAAGITKDGGIHALRHAYATHQLEAGLPVHQLQRLLGHRPIQTTLRYVHWIPGHQEGQGAKDLIADLEVTHG